MIDVRSLGRCGAKSPSLTQERSELHRYDHIEVVGRGATIRTDAESYAPLLHLLVLEGIATAQLHIRGWVMHDTHPMLR